MILFVSLTQAYIYVNPALILMIQYTLDGVHHNYHFITIFAELYFLSKMKVLTDYNLYASG